MLAFACAFTMFAGAAFTDQADITVDSDVVDTLVALGVIDGYEDGSFRPDDTVTRAEMAKMIYTVRTGRSDASAYNDDATSFTDITSHWARGYIKYCQSMGIIAGKSVTSFDPDGTVTTQEAAKMLLVTLGYDAEKAGLEGASWGQKTNALADENGLLTDVNNGTTQGLPRQYAAQLIFNAINAPTVEYRDGEYYNKNLIGLENDTIGEKYMGLQEWIGTFRGDDKMAGGKDGQITVYGSIDGQHKTISTPQVSAVKASFKYDFSNSYVGEEVSVLFKDGNTGTKNQPDDNDTIYGVYATGNTTVYNITMGDLQDADDGKVKFGDKQYKVTDADDSTQGTQIYVYKNYKSSSTKENVSAFDKTGSYYKDSADTIKFIEEDGEITTAYIVTTQFAQVKSVSSTKVQLSSPVNKTLTIEDHDIYDGIQKDDAVAVQVLYDDNTYVVTKADIVSAEVTSKKSDTEVRIDGTYKKLVSGSTAVGDYDLVKITDLGETYDFIMYGDYWVAAQQTSESAKDYAIVLAIDAAGGVSRDVKLLLADNTEKVYTIDKVEGTVSDNAMVAYSVNNDGTIKLYGADVEGDDLYTVAAAGSYNKNIKSYYDGKTANRSITSDAVAFVQYTSNSETKWVAVPAASSDNLGGKGSNTWYALDSDKVEAFAVVQDNKPSTAASDSAYGYVTSIETEKDGDDEYTIVSVWNGTDTVSVKYDKLSSSELARVAVGNFIKYKAVDNGVSNIDDVTYADGSDIKFGVVKAQDYDADMETMKIVDGAVSSILTLDDPAIIGVNTADREGRELADVSDYNDIDNDYNAVVIVEKDGSDWLVKAIFVDENNNIEVTGEKNGNATAVTSTNMADWLN